LCLRSFAPVASWTHYSVEQPWNVDLADQVFVKQKTPKSFDFLYDNTDTVLVRKAAAATN